MSLLDEKTELEKELAKITVVCNALDSARKERNRILNEISVIEKRMRFQEHNKYSGKYYKPNASNDNRGIIAFKIMNILSPPNESYARCLCITKGDTNDAFRNYSYGIRVIVVALWLPTKLKLMYDKNEPVMIDNCEEIQEEEFRKLFDEMSGKINGNCPPKSVD